MAASEGSSACILCGAIPPPPLTGEHIWPDWYNRQQANFRYELESTFQGQDPRSRRIQAMNLKPETLCKPCNNEWGSQLEKCAGPILTPMIQGRKHEITPAEARILSAWFFLKALVAEYLVPSGLRLRRFFNLDDGRRLKATWELPEGSRVWIGHYVGSRADAGWIMDRGSARQVSDDPAAGVFWHSVTYSIGQVLFHLFCVTRPVPLGPLAELQDPPVVKFSFASAPADWGAALAAIWEPPIVSVAWPPEKALDDNGFKYLAERWQQQDAGAKPKPAAD